MAEEWKGFEDMQERKGFKDTEEWKGFEDMEETKEEEERTAKGSNGIEKTGEAEKGMVEAMLGASEPAPFPRNADASDSPGPASTSIPRKYLKHKSAAKIASGKWKKLRDAPWLKARKKAWKLEEPTGISKEDFSVQWRIFREQERDNIEQEWDQQWSRDGGVAVSKSRSSNDTEGSQLLDGPVSNQSKSNPTCDSDGDVHMLDVAEEVSAGSDSQEFFSADDGIKEMDRKDKSPLKGVEKSFRFNEAWK